MTPRRARSLAKETRQLLNSAAFHRRVDEDHLTAIDLDGDDPLASELETAATRVAELARAGHPSDARMLASISATAIERVLKQRADDGGDDGEVLATRIRERAAGHGEVRSSSPQRARWANPL